MDFLLIALGAIVIMYVFMGFARRKQNQQQQDMMRAIKPGDRVLLTSEMFGTVRAVGDKQFVIELAPGTEVTVLQQAIVRVVTPDQEEFEYSDAVLEDDSAATEAETPTETQPDEAPQQWDESEAFDGWESITPEDITERDEPHNPDQPTSR